MVGESDVDDVDEGDTVSLLLMLGDGSQLRLGEGEALLLSVEDSVGVRIRVSVVVAEVEVELERVATRDLVQLTVNDREMLSVPVGVGEKS
jgi:hypothetical protein